MQLFLSYLMRSLLYGEKFAFLTKNKTVFFFLISHKYSTVHFEKKNRINMAFRLFWIDRWWFCMWLIFFQTGNFEIIHRVQLLQDALGKAILISKEANSRIEEFQVQLSILQRQCSSRDRPLCDTLRLRSFEDNGLLNILTRVRETWTRFGDPFMIFFLSLHSSYLIRNFFQM